MTWLNTNLPVLLAAVLILGVSTLFSGCYTLQQGATFLSYLGRAIPIEELRDRDGATEEDKLFVERVENIRRFAIEYLGLAASKNYTRYVALDRNFLAAVVFASAKDSFTRHEWWFPVVGRVPYKGFFNVAGARRERARLERRGLDVWISPVNAFSTLGWFRDPLFSFMRYYSERELADLIIHELVHATVWLNNHSQFNEELAQFIGTEGARIYMEKTHGLGPEDDSDIRSDRATYHAFLRSLIAELNELYQSDVSREEILKRRAEIKNAAQARFEKLYDYMFITDTFRGFSQLPINNAFLGLFLLYHEEDHFFRDLYERSGSNLPEFIAAAKTLNERRWRRNDNPREGLERALGLR